MPRLSTVQCLSRSLARKIAAFIADLHCGMIVRYKGLEFGMVAIRTIGTNMVAVCECGMLIPICKLCIRRNWELSTANIQQTPFTWFDA